MYVWMWAVREVQSWVGRACARAVLRRGVMVCDRIGVDGGGGGEVEKKGD